MPKLISITGVFFLFLGAVGIWDLVNDLMDKNPMNSWSYASYFITVVDIIIGIGLFLKWRLAYILLIASLSILIVTSTLMGLILVVGLFIDEVSLINVAWLAAVVLEVLVVSIVYRKFRKKDIQGLYFGTET